VLNDRSAEAVVIGSVQQVLSEACEYLDKMWITLLKVIQIGSRQASCFKTQFMQTNSIGFGMLPIANKDFVIQCSHTDISRVGCFSMEHRPVCPGPEGGTVRL